MADMMTFPETIEEFMEQYKITDTEQIYTNGTELVPIFRMRQWFEHSPSAEPETHGDLISRKAAIEALTHKWDGMVTSVFDVLKELPSAEPQWIPISERMPEDEGWYLVTDDSGGVLWLEVEYYNSEFGLKPFCTIQNPVAWMPLPEPWKGEKDE